jgi:glycosyltransferase involved in cell wall biosynthesis
MEEILIITNYYPPEKGAAANRIEQLALNLKKNNYAVSVVCPLGNYPEGKLFKEYKGKFSIDENRNGIAIKRLWIYPSVSKNLLVRIVSVLSFTLGLFFYLLIKKTPQKVVIQSPPLVLSFISVLVLSLKKKKLIVNVSDLWPLAAIELNVVKSNSISHKLSLFMERYLYKKATLLLGQSNEIIDHIHSLFPNKISYLYQNISEQKNHIVDFDDNEERPLKIFYAGLLGIAQGVTELCQKVDWKKYNIELHIYGDGAEKKILEELVLLGKLPNVFFHGMQERQTLHENIRSYDVALVPLKTRIYGSVPSKIFEYSCLGFPVLYFGGGEGETIVEESNLGWVAKVGDYSSLNLIIESLSKLKRTEINQKKKEVIASSKIAFDLNKQMNHLLDSNVF